MNQPQFKHQEFSIDATTRKKILRQDRIQPASKNYYLYFDSKKFEIENYSAFSIAIKSDDISFFKNDKLYKGVLRVDELDIFEAEYKLTRFAEDNIVVLNLNENVFPVEAILAIETIKKTLEEFDHQLEAYSSLPQNFKTSVSELRVWLEKLSKKINEIQKSSFEKNLKNLQEYEESVVFFTNNYMMKNLPKFAQTMGLSLAGVDEKLVKKCYEFLRNEVGHIFYKSTYGNRAYAKPRGYAGDFEMMNNVYSNELRGEDLFSKCMQRYFTDNPAGKAVRNRLNYLNNKIENTVRNNSFSKILAVASGPAAEIQKFLVEKPELAEKCEIHLIDQDDEALKYSQKEIMIICRAKNIKPRIFFHNIAIKNIINEGLSIGSFDLIYSAGLFDYFTDPVAQFACKRLFEALNPKGQLIIGNFSTNNPAQFIMEAIGDWYLIYRDEKTLKKLFNEVCADLIIESEPESVNLFAILNK